MKKVRQSHKLAGRIKRASNIVTLVFVALMAYTIHQWHRSMSIDNTIHIMLILLTMAINVKFYTLYLNLNPAANGEETEKSYQQLVKASVGMLLLVVIAKLALM